MITDNREVRLKQLVVLANMMMPRVRTLKRIMIEGARYDNV